MHPEGLAERILKFILAKGYRPKQVHELAEALGIKDTESGKFREVCDGLIRAGRVVRGTRNTLACPSPAGKITGTFRGHRRGFGFVIPETPDAHVDLYIPNEATGGAITGDTVVARVKKRGKRGGTMRYEGRIVEILERGQSVFVGELQHRFRRWFVIPDGKTLHVPIQVGDPTAKGTKAGDQVVVEITEYPTGSSPARGVIVKILGRRGEPGVDTLSIMTQYQFPESFGAPVLRAARRAVQAYDSARELSTREDLRKLTVVTIDPDDARDFDDAISVTKHDDGTTELGVHIADVAHFVREGSPLDREARERGNSVYLPGTVIPMLPEVLSNGVCSLQEHRPRLVKSVFVTYDKRGCVKRARFANAVIRSTKRLTYRQASAVLDGKPGRIGAKVVALLAEMDVLARAIRRRRIREGMLVLDLPAGELVFDEDRRVVDVVPEDTSFVHTIIEMFMVEANEAVARLLVSVQTPHLRRIHDEPDGASSVNLRKFLRALGFDSPDGTDRFALQHLLDKVRGRPNGFTVNLAVLRSMQQAVYSPRHIGHYALASKHYCHFTSPIRRYPDLAVHRLIDLHVRGMLGSAKEKRQVPSEDALIELGAHCSRTERHAEAAERELKLVLVLRLLERHLGDAFEGVVTGVANMGVFVQLDRYKVEGLLSFDALADDWWEVDASRGAAVGERTGHRVAIGDRLKVLIARVDLPNRQLELDLKGALPGASRKGDGNKKKGKSARAKQHGGRPRVKTASASGGRSSRRTGRRLSTKRGRGRRA